MTASCNPPDAVNRLLADREGAAIVEFAVVAPVMLLALMGMFDMGYNIYTDALLQGAIQKVARDSTIEGAGTNGPALNARVKATIRDLVPSAEPVFSRKAYSSFSDISQPEDFTDIPAAGDTAGDGICNHGESFEDANGNGTWDADRGIAGFGGARDAVLYTVTVTYPRPFPVYRFIGQSDTFTMQATTVLRNQPYNLQAQHNAVGTCP